MSAPVRHQRSRAKGSRLPAHVIVVSRGTKWGNPFKGESGAATMTREMLARQYLEWIRTATEVDPRDGVQRFNGCDNYLGVPYDGRPTLTEIRAALRGRDLACWCPLDQPCHADVLLSLANGATS